MYSVSEAYITAMKKAQRVERVRGTIGAVSFTDENVLALNYNNKCSDNKDVAFGSVRIGQLKAQFVNINIPRGQWRGQRITLEAGLTLADKTVEYIPLGVFYIAKADWSATGVTVTASDIISLLDAPVSFAQSSGTVYGYLTALSNALGVGLGVTEEECEAMPNGDMLLDIYPGAALSTWRDLTSYVAQVVGGFAYATRNGELAIKSFKDSAVVDEITTYEREEGTRFSDYTTAYAGISITDMETNNVMYYSGAGGSGGQYISLGSNPLLQYGVSSTKTRMRTAVADVASSITYTPFAFSTLSHIAYDLGDLLTCSGGIAGASDLTCCVMSIDWTFKSLTMWEGYGADPSLASSMSKADKAVAALAKNQKSDGITYYPYINTARVELTTTPKRLYRIVFATADTATVELWHETKWNNTLVGDTQTIKYEYYLDGVKFDYEPTDCFGEDGLHAVAHPFWLLNVGGGEKHTWEVRASLDSGTAIAAVGDLRAILKGQRLVGSIDFDGNIELADEYTALVGGQEVVGLSEAITLDMLSVIPNVAVTGIFTAIVAGQEVVGLVDNSDLTREKEQYHIVTEGGDNIATEDNDIIVT